MYFYKYGEYRVCSGDKYPVNVHKTVKGSYYVHDQPALQKLHLLRRIEMYKYIHPYAISSIFPDMCA